MPRELTDGDKQAMRDLVGQMMGRLFVPDAGVTLGGQPVRDFLAGPVPSNPFSRIQQSIGRGACQAWSRGDGSGIAPRRELLMRDTCSPYIDSIGDVPPGASFDPPFTGGQCAVTVYTVGWTTSCEDILNGASIGSGTGARVAGGTTFVGPISSIIPTPATFTPAGKPRSWVARVVSGGGTTTTDLPIVFTDIGAPGTNTERRMKSFSATFTRVSGPADTCGSKPPEWDAGRPGSGFQGPAPIPSPPGFDIPFPGITIGLNPDGTIKIDFGDGGPPLVVDPGDNPDAPQGSDPGPPVAGTPGATGEGGDDEGEAPEDKELWALRIDITSLPPRPNEYAPGVYRSVCYVYMGDDNGLDHDPAGAMLRSGQLVLAEKEGLTKYRVTANLGYNLTVTPFWRTPRKES